MLVYDVSDLSSFLNIDRCLDEIHKHFVSISCISVANCYSLCIIMVPSTFLT